jgi:hypothetical protein
MKREDFVKVAEQVFDSLPEEFRNAHPKRRNSRRGLPNQSKPQQPGQKGDRF